MGSAEVEFVGFRPSNSTLSDMARGMARESKVKAIQEAALRIMKDSRFRHPFYWSGFVLMGDGF